MTLLTFPKNFVWGTATASYQIEGYPLADGAGPSIWHRFSHTPGNIRGGHNGDLACEHYRRYPDDIALMKSLGIQGYRMSTAWPRVLPEGRGRSNEAGLDFYDRLIDALLEADITPCVPVPLGPAQRPARYGRLGQSSDSRLVHRIRVRHV